MSEHEKPKKTVHQALAHSYIVYFLALVAGILLDSMYQVPIAQGLFFVYLGLIFIMTGSILAIWAQHSARHLRRKKDQIQHSDFKKGPYSIIRTPTQFGLSLLILGYGLLVNSLFISLGAILAHTISQLVFIPKVEKFLEESYGEHYLHYKKMVKRL
jgi:protein-S-isoprenylcysteine O-methyltransferase Ste14